MVGGRGEGAVDVDAAVAADDLVRVEVDVVQAEVEMDGDAVGGVQQGRARGVHGVLIGPGEDGTGGAQAGAEVVQGGTEGVDAGVPQGAAAEFGAQADVGGGAPGDAERGAEGAELADGALGDQGADGGVPAVVDEHDVLHEDPSAGSGEGQQPGRGRSVGRQGFLCQDVFAGGERGFDPAGVKGGRQRYVHGVDGVVVEECLVAVDGAAAVAGSGGRRLRRVAAGDGDECGGG